MVPPDQAKQANCTVRPLYATTLAGIILLFKHGIIQHNRRRFENTVYRYCIRVLRISAMTRATVAVAGIASVFKTAAISQPVTPSARLCIGYDNTPSSVMTEAVILGRFRL